MKRFPLAKLSAVLAGSLIGLSAAHAADHTLTFAHVLVESTANAKAAMKFKEEVEKNSDGRIEVNVRPAAQLGGDVEIIEQTQMGLVDVAIPPTGNLANFEPKMYLYDLPFLVDGTESLYQLLDGDVGTELLETLDSRGLKGFNYWTAGFRNITNNVREINEPDDLKNIKMRVLQAPPVLSTYRAWGANPTAMAFTEVYNGLQQGVVEGQENPLTNIDSMKFQEVQKYMTPTNHAHLIYAAVMNKNSWESLPPDLQEVVANALEVARDFGRQQTEEDEKEILERMKSQIKITELTPEGRQKFIEKSQPIYEEFKAQVTPELLEKAIEAAKVN